jgi:hypothetical protein
MSSKDKNVSTLRNEGFYIESTPALTSEFVEDLLYERKTAI